MDTKYHTWVYLTSLLSTLLVPPLACTNEPSNNRRGELGASGSSLGGEAGGGTNAGGTVVTAGTGGSGVSAVDAAIVPGPDASEDFVVELTPNVRINDDEGSAEQFEVSVVARPDGLLFAGWVDRRTGTRCAYSISQDGGENWEENFFLDPSQNGITGDTVIAVDDAGTLYAGCQDYSAGQIMLSTSTDSGDSWSPWRPIQSAPDKPWLAAARDGTVFLTWLGGNAGFKRSLDRGQNWDTIIDLDGVGHGTAIAVGGDGLVHVAFNYREGDLAYRRSTDWGESLSPRRLLGPMGTACYGCDPRDHPITGAATDPSGQVVAIAWSSTLPGGDGGDDVWVLVSRNAGETWSERLRANDNAQPSRQFQPWPAVDEHGTVHVTWTDFRHDGDNATYYAKLTPDSPAFGENIELTDERGAPPGFMGDYKGIAVQGHDLVFAWCDSRQGNGDIYFSRLKNGARDPAEL